MSGVRFRSAIFFARLWLMYNWNRCKPRSAEGQGRLDRILDQESSRAGRPGSRCVQALQCPRTVAAGELRGHAARTRRSRAGCPRMPRSGSIMSRDFGWLRWNWQPSADRDGRARASAGTRNLAQAPASALRARSGICAERKPVKSNSALRARLRRRQTRSVRPVPLRRRHCLCAQTR